MGDGTDYIAEVVYHGVNGSCQFSLNVKEQSPLIDLVGDSTKIVTEGDCITLSVELHPGTVAVETSAENFKWLTLTGKEELIDDRFNISGNGKSLTLCNAQSKDETTYTVCIEVGNMSDCKKIDLKVEIKCATEDGTDYLDGDIWRENDFTNCTCKESASPECECVEQGALCDSENHELFFDENCVKRCAVKPGALLQVVRITKDLTELAMTFMVPVDSLF